MNKKTVRNLLLSLLFPCVACIVQWVFWDHLQPFTWILFYPAVFFSAQIGGLWGGMAATVLSSVLAVFFFAEPTFSFNISNPNALYSITVFILMGFLFSNLHERFIREQQKSMEFAMRKEVEQSLRMEAERLSLALESAQAGTWEWDLRTNKNTWSDELWKVYGLEPHSCEPSYETWRNTIHPDDRLQAEQAVQTAAQNITELRAEWRVVDKDGPVRWLMSRGKPILNEQGKAERFLGVVIDITGRRRAENEIRESEARYRSYIELTDQLGWVTNPNGEVEEDIPSFRKYTGQTYQETRGSGWTKAIHPDDLAKTVQAWSNAVAAKSRYEIEYRIRRHDGVYRDFIAFGVSVMENDNSVHEWVGTCIDITERKLADEKLRESEARYRLIADNAADVIWVMDPIAGKFTYVSPSVMKLRGYTPEEVMAQPLNEALTPESLKTVSESLSVTLPAFIAQGGGTQSFIREVDQPRKDGSIVNTEVTTTYLFNECGEVEIVGVSRDITERKHADDALRQSEENFSKAFMSSPAALLITRLADGRYMELNNAYSAIVGYDRDELLGHLATEFNIYINTGDRQAIVEQLLSKVSVRDFETRIRHRSGPIRHVVAAQELISFNGESCILSTLLDITERKQAEQEIQKQAELLHEQAELLEYAHVLVRDMDNHIVMWNKGMEKLYGWAKEETIGKTTHRFLQTEFPVSFEDCQSKLMQNGYWEGELTHTRKDGGKITVASHQVLYRNQDGDPYLILEVNNDITEWKLTEQALKKSEHRYRELVQNANSAIIRWKSDGTIAFFNEYAQSFFGYRPEEVMGKHVNIIVPQTESTGGDLSGLVKEIVSHPEQFTNYVNENICKDGHRVWMAWTNKPVFNEHGQVEEILAIGSDITDRKQMEDELRRSNAELEQFAYVASHDLQEPLRAVAGMVQLLGQRYKGKLDERADEYIGHAVEASTRMKKLINDLLDYSRVDRLGKPFEPTAVERSLNTALGNLQVSIQECHAQITHDPLPTVMADSGQLTQVFQNLIGNAIKFRGERTPQIHIGVEKAENAWRFSVRDNGIGIEPQYFERIFLVFQRLHTRSEYPGTGIGLSLCKKIVERHGGRMWVESQAERGSTFHFTIPEKKS